MQVTRNLRTNDTIACSGNCRSVNQDQLGEAKLMTRLLLVRAIDTLGSRRSLIIARSLPGVQDVELKRCQPSLKE